MQGHDAAVDRQPLDCHGMQDMWAMVFAGYVPGDAPGASSFFTPKAARKASRLAMQNPVIAQLDTALSR